MESSITDDDERDFIDEDDFPIKDKLGNIICNTIIEMYEHFMDDRDDIPEYKDQIYENYKNTIRN